MLLGHLSQWCSTVCTGDQTYGTRQSEVLDCKLADGVTTNYHHQKVKRANLTEKIYIYEEVINMNP